MGSVIEAFDPLARLLLEALLNSLWQGMLIAALVWLSLRLIKRASATTRHAVWLITLLTIGALPVVAIIARQGVLPGGATAQPVKQDAAKPALQTATPAISPATTPQVAPEADPFLVENQIARLNSPVRHGQPLTNNPSRQLGGYAGVVTLEESAKAVPAAAAVSSTVEKKSLWDRARVRVANVFSGVLPLMLIGLWLVVCALMLWRIGRSYRAVFRLRSRLGFVPSQRRERVQRLADLFGIRRQVHTFTSQQISMPMTVGSFRPLIILPSDLAENLSPLEFEHVVAHELAHIKRWDYVTNFLQQAVQSLFFFHPAVWFISKQLMIERELACDDWVVKTCEPRRYASCLTKIVELVSESKPQAVVRFAAAGIIFGKHVISRRVEMILNRDRNATTAVSKPALLYSIGLVVMLVALCSLISPVIAVPLSQKPPKQSKKENKASTATQPGSEEVPPLPPLPPSDVRLVEVPEPPEPPEPPELPTPPATAFTEPVFDLIQIPEVPVISATTPEPFAIAPMPHVSIAPVQHVYQEAIVTTPRPMPVRRPAIAGELEQDSRSSQPTIPETELLNVLSDIVKRDTDPNVRNEALQGICRLRSDAAINTLIQLYDGVSDVKIRSEVIAYLLRRNGDNSKAIAKLMTIAKSEKEEELRNKAIRYLGNVKGDDGANNLIQIYDGIQDPKMKQYVIRSLASNKSRKAIDKLILIAKNDSDPAVRQYAIRSLYGIDSNLYLQFVDQARPPRIGMLDGELRPGFPLGEGRPGTPRAFTLDGQLLEGHRLFEVDPKKWDEWQRDWQQKWEAESEKLRGLIDRMRIEGPDKLRIEDLQNRLRIELPKIELQLKDLEDKIKLGHEFNRIGTVESQLCSQLALVESQLATLRGLYAEANPKVVEVRNLRNALESQVQRVRSMRTPTPRRAGPRAATNVSRARAASTPSSY